MRAVAEPRDSDEGNRPVMSAAETDQAPRARRKQLRLAEAAVSPAGGHIPPPSQIEGGAGPAVAVADAPANARYRILRSDSGDQGQAPNWFVPGESVVDLNSRRAAMGLPALGLPVSPRRHVSPIQVLFLAVVCVLAVLVSLLIFLRPPLGAWIPLLG